MAKFQLLLSFLAKDVKFYDSSCSWESLKTTEYFNNSKNTSTSKEVEMARQNKQAISLLIRIIFKVLWFPFVCSFVRKQWAIPLTEFKCLFIRVSLFVVFIRVPLRNFSCCFLSVSHWKCIPERKQKNAKRRRRLKEFMLPYCFGGLLLLHPTKCVESGCIPGCSIWRGFKLLWNLTNVKCWNWVLLFMFAKA